MALLEPFRNEIAMTIHLNLFEGKCLTSPRKGVTDPDGTLRGSFAKLLIRSYLPGRKALKQWLKGELRAQIRAVAAYLPEGEAVRLDGHAHYHMLPVAFDALMEVIEEDGLKVSYLRIPRERLSVYQKHLHQLHSLAPVNLVKVMILNLLAWRNERKYRDYLDTLEKRLFLGYSCPAGYTGKMWSRSWWMPLHWQRRQGRRSRFWPIPAGWRSRRISGN